MIGLVFWMAVGLVAYTYLGYPLVITLLGIVRRPRSYTAHTPTVTLIVAAYDEEAVIAAKLDGVLDLDYPSELLQVIVAADGSTDGTPDIVRRYADRGVELVHRPERAGKMAAIERAAAAATGDILVFSDANNRLRPDALRELMRPFADPEVGAVTGRKVATGPDGLGFSEGLYWRYEAHLRAMETRLGCTVGVNGEIFSIRRSLFHPAPQGTINDDQWLAHRVMRLGSNVVFRPEAVSEETVAATMGEEAERRSRIVAGQYQVLARGGIPWRRPLVTWMVISHKVLRPLVPFGMIGATVASIAAVVVRPTGGVGALGGPWAPASLVAQVAFYGLALGGDRLGRVAYVPRFLVEQNLASLRGLWRHLRRSQAVTWTRAQRRSG